MNARTLKSHARVRSIVLRTLIAFENLSAKAPRTVEDIERIMSGR